MKLLNFKKAGLVKLKMIQRSRIIPSRKKWRKYLLSKIFLMFSDTL